MTNAHEARKKRIAAVVVTYNRKDLLLECVEHLRKQDLGAYGDDCSLDILICDNASTDGTAEALSFLIEERAVRYFNTGANLGGAGGFNYGMKQAVLDGYDYLWVMDDDCMTHADSLRGLLWAIEAVGGDFGFLSSVTRWTDGSICRANIQQHPWAHDITDFSLPLQPCTYATFVSLLVPAAMVLKEGLPIKEFFIWSDDWEFTRRLSLKYPCYVVGESVVTHASKSNGAGAIATVSPDRLDNYRRLYRNDVYVYRKEGLKGYAYLATRALLHIGKVLVLSKGDRLMKIKIILASSLEGMRFNPPIEYVSTKEA
ncbi:MULTISPECIES: glycosyltransferase [unclassified Adlercreutzia]|uniref:glycosyltransferase n=1 Tax=unclassified Adlercreutzia TaxID=2636013 RepID=UPI0013ECA90A|nr:MULTISPECIES: glycosyltransferase [unclassified Adlercreutzia]